VHATQTPWPRSRAWDWTACRRFSKVLGSSSPRTACQVHELVASPLAWAHSMRE
jgi:hypothetical protein